MNQEMVIFEALNATTDPYVERYGIPRVYCHGLFLGKYNTIVMTRFDQTLEYCNRHHKEFLSELRIMMILRRAV